MKITQQQLSEGITEELLNNLDFRIDGIKVQLEKDSEIVEVLKTGDSYFVIKQDGSYLKDSKGYKKISQYEAKIGLARYVLNHKEEYRDFINGKKTAVEIKNAYLHENKIRKEIERLKSKVDYALSALIKKMAEIGLYSPKIESYPIAKAMLSVEEENNPNQYKTKITMAENLVDDDFINLYEKLKSQSEKGENKDYDSLYRLFFQESGLPQIASFSYSKPQDIETLKKYFSRDCIESTLDMIKENSHLRNVAMFNLEK